MTADRARCCGCDTAWMSSSEYQKTSFGISMTNDRPRTRHSISSSRRTSIPSASCSSSWNFCAPPPVAMILTLRFMTSTGTRLACADDAMSVSRYEMSDDRSDVSNLVKLSRPPDGMRDVDERRRRCDWNARDDAEGELAAGRWWCCWASDFGPRMPLGLACWGGDGVLRGSHAGGRPSGEEEGEAGCEGESTKGCEEDDEDLPLRAGRVGCAGERVK